MLGGAQGAKGGRAPYPHRCVRPLAVVGQLGRVGALPAFDQLRRPAVRINQGGRASDGVRRIFLVDRIALRPAVVSSALRGVMCVEEGRRALQPRATADEAQYVDEVTGDGGSFSTSGGANLIRGSKMTTT